MPTKVDTYDHDSLARAIAAYTELREVEESPELLRNLEWRIERWRQGLYILVVVGEVKKGKSSFINALLGVPSLCPVADRIASSVPVEIVHGPELRFFVHWLPDEDGNDVPPEAISQSDLPRYATETGIDRLGRHEPVLNAAGDLRQVARIEIQHPHPLLEQGLRIVDLPGLGGVFRHHSRIVWEYLEPSRVDHIAFVLDSTGNPLDNAEEDLLRKLRERRLQDFLFIQSKIDAPDPDKMETWTATNKNGISRVLDVSPEDLAYFPVSSRLEEHALRTGDAQDHADSGFERLHAFLRDRLMREKRDRLAEPLLADLAAGVDGFRLHIDELTQIFDETSKSKRETANAQSKAEQVAHAEWQAINFVEIQRDLTAGLREAKANGNDRIDDELGLAVSVVAYQKMDQSAKSERGIVEMLDDAKELCITKSIAAHASIESEYLSAIETHFDRAAERMRQTLKLPQFDPRSPRMDEIVTMKLRAKNRMMEGAMRMIPSATIGGALGSAVAAMVVGAAAGPIGAIIGAVAVTWKVLSEARERNREAALTKAKAVLDHACVQAQQRVRRVFRDLSQQAEMEMTQQLQDFVKQRAKALTEKVQASDKAVKATEKELVNEKAVLDLRQRAVAKVAALLRKSAGLD